MEPQQFAQSLLLLMMMMMMMMMMIVLVVVMPWLLNLKLSVVLPSPPCTAMSLPHAYRPRRPPL